MLDKVSIRLRDFDNRITDHIKNHADLYRDPNVKVENYLGTLHNLIVVKNDILLTIYGSVTKVAFATNSHNVDIRNTSRAVRYIIKEFSLPEDTKISEIEVGLNIPVNGSIPSYLNSLNTAKGYKKQVKIEAKEIVYQKRKIRMRFYDKSEDLMESNMQHFIRDHLKTSLFRYEIILKYPCKDDNSRISIGDLEDKHVLKNLLLIWHDEFNKIIPNPYPVVDFHPNSPKDVYRHLMVKGIEAYGGLKNFLSNNVLTFSNNSVKNTYSRNRMKDHLYSLAKNHVVVKPCECYDELRQKITFHTMHLISSLKNEREPD